MEERKTGYLLKLVVERLRVDVDAGLKQHNLTWVQSRLIGFLAYRGGQATQKELERFLEVSHPTVVGIVSRMEQNGFVECRTDRLDRRNKLVSLTRNASEVSACLEKAMQEQDRRMFAGFTEEERDQMDAFLSRIYHNLSGPEPRAKAPASRIEAPAFRPQSPTTMNTGDNNDQNTI